MDYDAFIALKKKKAAEQMKAWWFEAVLTSEEANFRTSKGRPVESSCNFCKKFTAGRVCGVGYPVTDCLSQICDEWKYFA